MAPRFCLDLAENADAATLGVAGGKGAALVRLTAAGLPVPGGFIVTTEAYRAFVAAHNLQAPINRALASVGNDRRASALEAAADEIGERFLAGEIPAPIEAAIAEAYGGLGERAPVAVRSSATAEDLPDLSFAGQQDTYLNIQGIDAVVGAVRRCWASLWTARAIDYRLHHAVPQGAVALAVVVQHLVPAEVAGIMFTANPMTGARDEVVINAAWGLGEAIVSGSVSPDTIVVDKATGAVKQYDVAEKAVMTAANAGTGVETRAVDAAKQRRRALTEPQISELVTLGREIEALSGTPQDIEWCWADGASIIVQARPITTLGMEAPLPTVPEPDDWQVPNPRAKYLRNNIVELIPDPMSPLFATLGRRAINTSLGNLMAHFFGRSGIVPDELIIEIEGYAYYNGDFSTKAILHILLGSVGIAKRMFSGMEARVEEAYATYQSAIEGHRLGPEADTNEGPATATAHLDAASALMEAAIGYYGALVGGLIPAAWITEGLFTAFYKTLVKRRQDPRPAVFLLGFDSLPIQGEKALYDLTRWAATQPDLGGALLATPTGELAGHLASPSQHIGSDAAAAPEGVPGPLWETFVTRFADHLATYGGTIYDLDFAKPTPVGDPTPVLEALKLFLRGEGKDPHTRQQTAAEAREAAVAQTAARLKGMRRRWFAKLLARAQHYAPQREDGLTTLGLGYPLVRQHLLAVGRQLVTAGALSKADDVFWLPETTVRDAAAKLERHEPVANLEALAAAQRRLWEARRRVTPPLALPLLPKWLRRLIPSLGAPPAAEAGGTLRGTACSPGTVTATARVLLGPANFDTLKPGEVLVAGITTPAWTPLFALAGAVVTDVGGPLSHGSIVAREYGIPAVLGTGNATRRIRSGDRVRVDGAAGTVTVL
ncbi:MAG: phosphoenolpyruvate synthase [Anaerolineae bacterium]|nr:phosphoenolpyruvate synthase [Anaerolineae bacterium]